jgi:hypothetical protein
MASILNKLANYGVESAEVTYQSAPQEPVYDLDLNEDEDTFGQISDSIDDDIAAIIELADSISAAGDEIVNAQVASQSIEDIVDQTILTYGKDGITEQGADLMRLSLEAVLKLSGLNIPTSVVVPSFESNMSRSDYSTEAEEKKKGIITRILEWVSTAWSALIEVVSTFWKRLFTNTDSIGKYGEAVIERCKKAKGSAEGNLNLGTQLASYCSTKTGEIKPPASIVAGNVQLFGKFISAWHGAFESLISIKAPVGGIRGFNEFARTAASSLEEAISRDLSHLKSIQILENRSISFTGGANKWVFLGSKVTLVNADIKTKGEARILTQAESLAGTQVALKGLEIMKKIESDINDWVKGGKAVVSGCKRILAEIRMAESSGAVLENSGGVKEYLNAILGACRSMGDGWTKATPEYLKMLKANIRYCDLSVGKLKGEDKADSEDAPGHTEKYNKHTNEGGDTFDSRETHASAA